MNIFITGGSGFVGSALCRELRDKGHELSCLVRPGSELRLIKSDRVKAVSGDLFQTKQLVPLVEGADAVIHLVGIIREVPAQKITFTRLHELATQTVVAATQQAGVKRYLHMSANGTDKDALSAYHKSKWLAEETVRNSNLDWTIFRPSLIYGKEDQFINMLAGLIRTLPVVPVMGNGDYRMQPVSVDLLAKGFATALEQTVSVGKTYHCGGKECLSYNELLDIIGTALGLKKVRKLHQPLSLMRPIVAILQSLPFFPITSDQLQMLIEGNCCDNGEWCHDLDLQPKSIQTKLDYLSGFK
jgi:NADH dehydrogenase